MLLRKAQISRTRGDDFGQDIMSQGNPPHLTAASILRELNPPKSLHDAAELGSIRAAKLFCEHDDFEPNRKDRSVDTALFFLY